MLACVPRVGGDWRSGGRGIHLDAGSSQEEASHHMRSESLTFLKELVEAPSPSGFEQPAAKVFRDYVDDFADEVDTNVMGSVHAVVDGLGVRRRDLLHHHDPGDHHLVLLHPSAGRGGDHHAHRLTPPARRTHAGTIQPGGSPGR